MRLEPEIIALITVADEAREQARTAVAEHTTRCHVAAAALLRTAWPRAAAIVADLSMHLFDSGNPDVRTILDADGKTVVVLESGNALTDRVELLLAGALDYTKATLAGWAQNDNDDTHYTLVLPEAS